MRRTVEQQISVERVKLTKVIIQRPDGCCLVLRTSKWPERPDREYKPDLPGGTGMEDESFDSCAARETLEETGIDLDESKLVPVHAGTVTYEDDKVNVSALRIIYLAKLDYDPEVFLSWEHDQFEWQPFEEILKLEWRPYFRDAFEFIKASEAI